MRRWAFLLAVLSGCSSGVEDSIRWQPWADEVLSRASKENRLVLLSLETGVASDPCVRDPEVLKLVRKGYLPVKTDPRERPDLAGPCQVRSWPAVLVLDAGGRKLAERAGPLSAEA